MISKEDVQELKLDLKEVKNDVKDIAIQLTSIVEKTNFNTETLLEHQRRSLASENRLKIVEGFTIKSLFTIKLLGYLGAFLLFCVEFLPSLIKLFQ